MSDSIPNALKIINDGVREYNQKLRDREKLDLPPGIMPPDRHVILVACNPKRSFQVTYTFMLNGFLIWKKVAELSRQSSDFA